LYELAEVAGIVGKSKNDWHSHIITQLANFSNPFGSAQRPRRNFTITNKYDTNYNKFKYYVGVFFEI